jgi:hypothetical protein
VNLTAALNAWSARPELAGFHNDFIELTESVLNARLHERHVESFVTAGIAPGGFSVVLIDTVTEVLGARVGGVPVDFRSRDEVMAARSNGSTTVLGCVVGRTVEISTAATQIEIRARTKIPTAASGGTNWVLVNFPNVYLFGCLVELFDHLRDEGQTAHYKARFEEALAIVNSTMLNRSQHQSARVRSAR